MVRWYCSSLSALHRYNIVWIKWYHLCTYHRTAVRLDNKQSSKKQTQKCVRPIILTMMLQNDLTRVKMKLLGHLHKHPSIVFQLWYWEIFLLSNKLCQFPGLILRSLGHIKFRATWGSTSDIYNHNAHCKCKPQCRIANDRGHHAHYK